MSGVDAADTALAHANERLGAFVSPRTLLEQARPSQPPKPLTALDREQLDGLVCPLHHGPHVALRELTEDRGQYGHF